MDSAFDLIPNEVVIKIFEYLEVGDLLSCGLTCRRWNSICQDKRFFKLIVLDLGGEVPFSCMRRFVKLFLASERKYLNLSISCLDFTSNEDDEGFWVRFGYDITSLTVVECQMAYSKFAKILMHLPNLKSLTLDKIELFEDLPVNLYINDLDCLENIETLNFMYECQLEDAFFMNVMRLMPNIKHLKLLRYMETPSNLKDITWECLKKYIVKQAKKLKTLSIQGRMWDEEIFVDLSQIEILNLEVLELMVGFYTPRDARSLSLFLKTQKNLKTLKIYNENLLDYHVIRIANYFKHLEVLNIQYSRFITHVGISELYKLNNLKSLTLVCPSIAIIDGIKKNLSKFKNDKLNKLELEICFHNQEEDLYIFVSNICKLYMNLTVLKLGMTVINDVVVQLIIENLRWLKTLQLDNCAEVTDYGLTGVRPDAEGIETIDVGLSILRLQGLKHLLLHKSRKFSEDALIELAAFKELRELHIGFKLRNVNPAYVKEIFQKYRSLKYLFIVKCNCKRTILKNLKIITFHNPRLKMIHLLDS